MMGTITGRLPSVSSDKSQDVARPFTHLPHLPSMREGVYTYKKLADSRTKSALSRTHGPPYSEVVTAVKGSQSCGFGCEIGGNSGVNFTLEVAA